MITRLQDLVQLSVSSTRALFYKYFVALKYTECLNYDFEQKSIFKRVQANAVTQAFGIRQTNLNNIFSLICPILQYKKVCIPEFTLICFIFSPYLFTYLLSLTVFLSILWIENYNEY